MVTGVVAAAPVAESTTVMTSPSGSPSLPASVELTGWSVKTSKLSSPAIGGVFSALTVESSTSITSSLAAQLPFSSQTSSSIVSSPVKSTGGV